MIIQFECENCKHLMTVPIELQGRPGHCAKCYTPIKVPFAAQVTQKKRGIGRFLFTLWIMPIFAIYFGATYYTWYMGYIKPALYASHIPYHLAYLLAAFPLMAYVPIRYRHRNLGYSSSNTNKILIPLYNFYLLWRGMVYPHGYAAHRKSDRTSIVLKIITAFLVSPAIFFTCLAFARFIFADLFR